MDYTSALVRLQREAVETVSSVVTMLFRDEELVVEEASTYGMRWKRRLRPVKAVVLYTIGCSLTIDVIPDYEAYPGIVNGDIVSLHVLNGYVTHADDTSVRYVRCYTSEAADAVNPYSELLSTLGVAVDRSSGGVRGDVLLFGPHLEGLDSSIDPYVLSVITRYESLAAEDTNASIRYLAMLDALQAEPRKRKEAEWAEAHPHPPSLAIDGSVGTGGV